MKSTKERKQDMLEIKKLVAEWFAYVNGFGNECAYTDSILESIQKRINEM